MFTTSSRENVAPALRALIGTKAETAYEKYTLLEQRDKILRKGRQRVNDVQRAAVFVGACPDMCPEKERYERELQKRLSQYEMAPASTSGVQEYAVDHRRAVKDYGRSAADQEEPLPYELRPAPVLEMTMYYLLNQIAYNEPSEETQLPGWYDFLWKRTRAIRKDMTQQMLEGDIALSLLEKCARFHIFCAHRLCELDIGEFDQRMNTENLTKCLQSLKHMYEDMGKKGMPCPNEAEFRAYDVLLSLNDTDVLRQILTYGPQVRQSSHVRFALKLFSSLQNNNYVAFFRLVRCGATYLQACLAHRYFKVVRAKSFNTLVRSYGANSLVGARQTLPRNYITEATKFALAFGLTTHPKDGCLLVLNRWQMTPIEEQQQPSVKRSHPLVESKRQANLGEILNGGPLLPTSIPSPVVSFDENNCYRGDKLVNDILQNATAVDTSRAVAEEQKVSLRAAQYIAAGVIEPVIASGVLEAVQFEVGLSKLAEAVVGAVVSSTVRTITKQTVDGERKTAAEVRHRELLRQAAALFKEKTSNEILTTSVGTDVRRVAQELFKEEQRIQTQNQLCEATLQICAQSLDEAVAENVNGICLKFFQKEVQAPLMTLDNIRTNLTNLLVQRYFFKWKSIAFTKSYRRRLLNDFPSCPTLRFDDDGRPPGKRRRTSLGTVSMSAPHWTEILSIRDFALKSIITILTSAVNSVLLVLVTEEIRHQKSQNAQCATLAPGTTINVDGLKRMQLLHEFPCHPLSLDDDKMHASPEALQSIHRRSPNDSIYSWMDVIQTLHKPKQEHQTPIVVRPEPFPTRTPPRHMSVIDTEPPEDDDQKRNYFRDIPLTPSHAIKQDTVAAVKRLRSAVQAERRVSTMELGNWSTRLDDEGGSNQ